MPVCFLSELENHVISALPGKDGNSYSKCRLIFGCTWETQGLFGSYSCWGLALALPLKSLSLVFLCEEAGGNVRRAPRDLQRFLGPCIWFGHLGLRAVSLWGSQMKTLAPHG